MANETKRVTLDTVKDWVYEGSECTLAEGARALESKFKSEGSRYKGLGWSVGGYSSVAPEKASDDLVNYRYAVDGKVFTAQWSCDWDHDAVMPLNQSARLVTMSARYCHEQY
jgi:hypothetical protein